MTENSVDSRRPCTRRRALLGAAMAAGVGASLPLPGAAIAGAGHPHAPFVCPPCGCRMDGREFAAPGICPACAMTLVPKSPPFEPAVLPPGSSMFLVGGGAGHENARIAVHYLRPASYHEQSPILLVLPGAGRDGAEYRDAWRDVAEARGIFVAALAYPAQSYGVADYHFGGVITDLSLRNAPRATDGSLASRLHLRDDDVHFRLVTEPRRWLFTDFDRLFALLADALGATRRNYDLFGHSAGAQLLHRSVLFAPPRSACRIVAANAGMYTLPRLDTAMPLGLRGYGFAESRLAQALGHDLTILVGERDDARETRGTLLHTPRLDAWGTHRLARARSFFAEGRRQAGELGTALGWRLQVVPDVGHDFRAMSQVAGRLLYG